VMASGVSWVAAAATGMAAGWYVPVLARVAPSRDMGDRFRLATWTGRQRTILSATGLLAMLSVIVRLDIGVEAVVAIALAPSLITSAAVDLRTHRLPDRLVTVGFVVAVFGGVIVAWQAPAAGPSAAMGVVERAVCGSVAFSGILGLSRVLRPDGMGAGDVKLAAVLGCFVGVLAPTSTTALRQVLAAVVLACALTLIAGSVLNARQRCSLSSAVPFGPGLVASTWIVVLIGAVPAV
jgi:leader peptidase (prepilin peptidase) / N-methyltransferase